MPLYKPKWYPNIERIMIGRIGRSSPHCRRFVSKRLSSWNGSTLRRGRRRRRRHQKRKESEILQILIRVLCDVRVQNTAIRHMSSHVFWLVSSEYTFPRVLKLQISSVSIRNALLSLNSRAAPESIDYCVDII